MQTVDPRWKRLTFAVWICLAILAIAGAQVSALPRLDERVGSGVAGGAGAAGGVHLGLPQQEPSATPSCEEQLEICEDLGLVVFNQCITDGGPPAACAQRADNFVADCMIQHDCPPPTPFQNTPDLPVVTAEAATATVTPTATIPDVVLQTATITPSNTVTPTKTQVSDVTPTKTITPTNTITPTKTQVSDVTPTKTQVSNVTLTPSPTPSPGEPVSPTVAATATLTFCQSNCAQQRQIAYDQCIAGGGSADTCKAKADLTYQECLVRLCGQPTPVRTATPVLCIIRCQNAAKAALAACKQAGGSDAECNELASRTFQECLATCPTVTPPSPGAACKLKCVDVANEAYLACLRDPAGSPEICRARFEAVLNECIELRCSGADGTATPGPAVTPILNVSECISKCDKDWRRKQQECIKISDAQKKRVCRDRAQADYLNCKARCYGTPIATPTRTPFPRRP